MAQKQAEKAVRLFGAATVLRSSIGSVIDPVDQERYKKNLNRLRVKLGRERYKEAWDEGRAMSMKRAVAYALEKQGS